MAISVVSFSFSWCSAGGPGAQLSAGFLYNILSLTYLISNPIGGPKSPFCRVVAFSTTSCLQLVWFPTHSGVPRDPSAGWWLSLPHLYSNFSGPQLTDFLSPPSYIIVQSPTQSLEWHVWSSSSGNNCHAVHRSLSSGASVYECTMGFLPCPIFSAKPAYAISSHNYDRNVSLPSGTSLWNGILAGSKVNIQHKETDTVTRVQILAVNICISHSTNTFRKVRHPSILTPSMGNE